ncbi:dihydroorotase [Leucothrix sargassi]|nr:dihydroorotase [Leucothrix sargassi]
MSQLLFKQGRLIDPANGVDKVCDVLVTGKKISLIANEINGASEATVIDATDKWILPGVVDLGAYIRHQERKATVETESVAAAQAGITRLCCMPEYDKPTYSTAEVNLIQEKATRIGNVWFEVIGGMTVGLQGEQLTNMGGLKKAGCVAVSQGHHKFASLDVMRKAMEYAKTAKLKLFLHPLEYGLIGNGCVHEGAIATRVGLPGIPVAAETVALSQILLLAKETQSSIHFCRLSSAAGVELVRDAKAQGLAVTADVAAHQLHLTEYDIKDYNPLCHVTPPLRSEADRDALRQAVADGVIDAVCSDHQPHDIDAKLAPFQESSPGISGLETLLPLTMKLVNEGALTLEQAIGSLSFRAAQIIDKPVGSLAEGSYADMLVYDPQQTWTLDPEAMLSNGKNTPFGGWEFSGKVAQTYTRGKRADINVVDGEGV